MMITTRQALAVIGRSEPATLLRYVHLGRLPVAVKAPGLRGAYFFHLADVEVLAAELNPPDELEP